MSVFTGCHTVAALACSMLLLLAGPRHTAGQGLSATNEQLGASAAATATEFDTFEDLLSLSTTGGRGRGGRSGSGNLGSSFRESRDFAQLQTSVYYVGGSPPEYNSFNTSQTPGGLNYVPKPREQGSCNSCVGQAVAAAIQMSIAYITREPVEKYNVSAGALYYCVAGGRTCKTGWDIPIALRSLESTPQWMLPDKCFNKALEANSAGAAEPDISDFSGVCRATTVTSKDDECKAVTKEQPRYSCSFKSLSSFWQIQQHIRTYGSVITRIAIYDDFNVQFNSSASTKTAMQLPPYSRNVTAKLQYGHAAVIVGYDNDNFTWTILNSWGSGLDPTNPRKTGGTTADGMFRIRMGVAGVGTPDLTYGVVCEPADGSVDNIHANDPWLSKTRLPLTPIGNRAQGCYNYAMLPNDTFAGVADHFDVDIGQLVQANLNLFSVIPNMTYKYQTILSLGEMQDTLRVVQNATQRLLGTQRNPLAGGGAIEPYFMCTYYDPPGKPTAVKCDQATLQSNPTICTRNGTVACTLFYSDVNVTQTPLRSTVKVCNPSWTDIREFNKVAFEVGTSIYGKIPEKQEVAMRRVLQAIDPRMDDAEASSFIRCSPIETGTTDWAVRQTNRTRRGVSFSLAIGCSNTSAGGDVVGLYLQVLRKSNKVFPQMYPNLDDKLVLALLDLPQLSWLYMFVYGGQVAPQLGALNLSWFTVYHYCMVGQLPPNLLYGWGRLGNLAITRQGDALDYNDPTIGVCGISGPIPNNWKNKTRQDVPNSQLPDFIYSIDLSGNLLSGSLPDIIGGNNVVHSLKDMQLSHNNFEGRVPEAWGQLTGILSINVQQNQLSGPLPVVLNGLERQLEYLIMDNNAQLSGCVPLTPYTTISFEKTGVIGRCAGSSARDTMHKQQRDAVAANFMQALSVNVDPQFRSMLRAVVNEINNTLGNSVQPGQVSKTFQQNHPQGEQRGFCKVSVTLIEGIEYITSINIGVTNPEYFAAAGLNFQRLLPLLQQLPGLKAFICDYCYRANLDPVRLVNRLPSTLPAITPNLTRLGLKACGLVGTVPATYGDWQLMEELMLPFNFLTGRLPSELQKLQKLKVLYLGYNNFRGVLPTAWSALPKELYLGLEHNTNINGTIPTTFASNTGTFYNLFNTSISGCRPRSLLGNFLTRKLLDNGTVVLQDLRPC